jgi:hypothetical protein
MMKLSEILFEKLELVNWDLYCDLVTEAYENAPDNDPEAIKSFSAMRDSVNKFFNIIESKVKVEFVDGDPYQTAEQMREEIKETKTLKVMKDFSEHPFFSQEENWKFRAVHDWFTHVITKQPFTRKGELSAYNTHIKMFPPSTWPALFTEIIGQVCYQTKKGAFGVQKVAILKGFDYKNIGRVEGYVLNNKELVKPETNS